ncbi:hypothetical protein QOZ80_3BG0296450 [Eleusine coracana subsp. coracana]|nr:hypothetical protein QOZ80_3BG0296450 [Eleusine coracana subsp. coracana]
MEDHIKIKLAVDRSRNRVLFADAGSEFADILLSFLKPPLSAVQFCMGMSSPDCLSNLCDSVTSLKNSDLLKTSLPCDYDCNCWHVMGRLIHMYRRKQTFLERNERFVICDDWVIKPASTSATLSLLQSSGHDLMEHSFEEVEVSVSWDKVLSMLKASLSSETIFSDVFYPTKVMLLPVPLNVKLFLDKNEKTVMYAECKHELVDLLFTSLTYPLYCLIKSTGDSSYLGRSFHNLYSSAVDLHAAGLLTGCEFATKELCLAPFKTWGNDPPKFLNDVLSEKCQFVKDRVYLVDDGLHIYQASAMSVAKHWCNKDKDDVVEMNVTMDREEAVALMRAVVTSKTALTDVF